MIRSGNGRLNGTRQAVLNILRRRGGGVSVDELATELELTGATVRRHLDVLLRDDLVSVSQARGRTGRPRYVFALTEASEELFPHHYVRLTHRLLEEIVALGPEETAGRGGDAIAELVFGKMADRLAGEYAPLVSGSTVEARARSAVALLSQDGLDFDVVVGEDGVRLLGRGCPCTRIGVDVEATTKSCAHDRRLLERVLGVRVRSLGADEIPYDFLSGYLIEADAPAANGSS
ncbi:MAG: helix-turn-helix domain-containing protein [Chloroflexi bacterium]|nr:helix-turn-helix domain-containing protein [Chloroflexota bacterium]MDA1004548.1 helix-turn-helix domain-containing protein [Chloroflexota bacterium]